MRAVLMREFGPPGVLTVAVVPDPVPGPGQVLIAVEAAGISFVETQVRAGRGPNPAMRPELPVTPGNGVAGEIVAAGPGVAAGLVGARVVSTTGGTGGYAELVAVDAALPIPVPAGLPLPVALALLADGRTALVLSRQAAPAQGEWVLVEAAGGGVGSLLVQLAVGAGAHVVAAASNAAKLEVARGAGAELGVDYTRPGWADEVRAATGGVAVVFDGVGGAIGRTSFGLVNPGGRFVVHGVASGEAAMPDPAVAEERGVTVIGLWSAPLTPEEARALSVHALDEAVAGRLRPTIGQTFPLERAADAHAAIQARTAVGKTLLVTRPG
jgi:NADPH2:quinone reductase